MPKKINQSAKGANGEQLLNLISSSDLTSLLSPPPPNSEVGIPRGPALS